MTGAQRADVRRDLAERIETGRDENRPADASARDVVKAAEIERRQRRRFQRIFGGGLFADPGRDMLLDLFVAEAAGRETSMVEVCAAGGTPVATALRYVAELERTGLIQKSREDGEGHGDARIALTARGSACLHAYLIDEPTFATESGPG